MPKYYAKYRCLLCGKVFPVGQCAEVPDNKLQALLESAIKYRPYASNPAFRELSPPEHAVHNCNSQSIGLGVFAGFEA